MKAIMHLILVTGFLAAVNGMNVDFGTGMNLEKYGIYDSCQGQEATRADCAQWGGLPPCVKQEEIPRRERTVQLLTTLGGRAMDRKEVRKVGQMQEWRMHQGKPIEPYEQGVFMGETKDSPNWVLERRRMEQAPVEATAATSVHSRMQAADMMEHQARLRASTTAESGCRQSYAHKDTMERIIDARREAQRQRSMAQQRARAQTQRQTIIAQRRAQQAHALAQAEMPNIRRAMGQPHGQSSNAANSPW